MNYLFVIPHGVSKAQVFDIFPIGIAYVSASLKQAGYSVFTINLEFHADNIHRALQDALSLNDIDVICTGGLSFDCSKVKEVLDIARTINPRLLTVVGGGIISADPVPAMRVLGADFGIIGEGEVTMCELAFALDTGLSYHDVQGVVWKEGHGDCYVVNPERPEILDLDSLSFPGYDGFNYYEWTKKSGYGLIVGSRSCTHNCTFCFHTSGKKYRQRSLDNIFEEISYQIDRYDIKTFSLNDELFASSKRRVYEFCDRIRKYGISWYVALRVCDVDADLLQTMKGAGCAGVSYGLESADNSVLESMQKKTSVEQIEHALEMSYEAGINITGGFIFGDINENQETATNTLNFWHRNNGRHYMNLSMIVVFPGSFLYKHACETGLITDREQFLRDGCPLINVSKLSDVEYKNLTSRITELRLHPHVPAGSFEIRDIKPDGASDIEIVCRKCGGRSQSEVSFWFGREISCQHCGLINFVDPFQNALHAQDTFVASIPADEKVVLWGAGGIYYKLAHKYSVLSMDRFLLVDANTLQQGLSICSKEIFPPDVIAQDSIKTVVVMALSRKNEIYAEIRRMYPSVQNILIPAFNITKEGIVPVLQPFDVC